MSERANNSPTKLKGRACNLTEGGQGAFASPGSNACHKQSHPPPEIQSGAIKAEAPHLTVSLVKLAYQTKATERAAFEEA
mmetsp:Transcript_59259/g.117707  ORF Transcript_59259/g.117707 Transcript_59259/m.117707 type:complete len:80 (+) Transcript_59259:171-410(+)